jgi:hypothetical protein
MNILTRGSFGEVFTLLQKLAARRVISPISQSKYLIGFEIRKDQAVKLGKASKGFLKAY